jgi:single-strand DNA-binding protein
MASYNKMQFIGNLGGDPESRYVPGVNGQQLATSFNVAVNDKVNGPTPGTKIERTQWFRVTCWNKLAEIALAYLKKGSSVMVEGPLVVREYTGNDGQKRFSLDVTARELQMLDRAPAREATSIQDAAPVNDTPIPDAAPRRSEGELVGAAAGSTSDDDPGDLDA